MSYIHEHEPWPTFRWRDEALASTLARVRHRQGRLVGRMEALGFGLRAESVLQMLTDDVTASSGIEGERLDRAEVRSSIARRLGMDVAGLISAGRDVDGVVEMMLDATQRHGEPLTDDRLFGWHNALFPSGRSGMSRLIIGDWRNDQSGPMQVVSGPIGRETVHFEAPAANRLPHEMHMFLAWLEQDKPVDPVVVAAIAHLWFVTIHPFDDGNGRIARAIADMALARSERSAQRFYSMSAQIEAERQHYYAMLESTQKGDLDITDWLLWFLDCLDRAFDKAEQALQSVLAKARFWEAVRDHSLNERQRLVLNRLLDGFEGKLTSSKWAKLAKCSQDSASRDIDDLVRKGVLARSEAGGRSTSYAVVHGVTG